MLVRNKIVSHWLLKMFVSKKSLTSKNKDFFCFKRFHWNNIKKEIVSLEPVTVKTTITVKHKSLYQENYICIIWYLIYILKSTPLNMILSLWEHIYIYMNNLLSSLKVSRFLQSYVIRYFHLEFKGSGKDFINVF